MLEDVGTSQLRPVINATGVVLHTNLGRAALADAAVAAIQAAAGTCSLELDLATGERGPRAPGIEALLRELTGAEAAVAVNNGAGAVLQAHSAQEFQRREAIVEPRRADRDRRGLRVPDVAAQSGVQLREVGRDQARTHLRDLRRGHRPRHRAPRAGPPLELRDGRLQGRRRRRADAGKTCPGRAVS